MWLLQPPPLNEVDTSRLTSSSTKIATTTFNFILYFITQKEGKGSEEDKERDRDRKKLTLQYEWEVILDIDLL